MAGTLAALQRGREMTTAAAPLDGRTVLVVGGAGRLGSAICRDLRARGGRVIVGYRTSREAADRLASEIDGTAVRIDTADDASIEVRDLIHGNSFTWHGKTQTLDLDPQTR
ncbi:MAG: NAD-dependent epimerase/dehydratase family protein, partial [Micrococcales bacterium]|nr:NAD-dependent epimerase/dehydratase family protein [Micrococcales bacterium]